MKYKTVDALVARAKKIESRMSFKQESRQLEHARDIRKRSLNFHHHFMAPVSPVKEVAFEYMKNIADSRRYSNMSIRELVRVLETGYDERTFEESNLIKIIPLLSSNFDFIPVDRFPSVFMLLNRTPMIGVRSLNLLNRLLVRLSNMSVDEERTLGEDSRDWLAIGKAAYSLESHAAGIIRAKALRAFLAADASKSISLSFTDIIVDFLACMDRSRLMTKDEDKLYRRAKERILNHMEEVIRSSNHPISLRLSLFSEEPVISPAGVVALVEKFTELSVHRRLSKLGVSNPLFNRHISSRILDLCKCCFSSVPLVRRIALLGHYSNRTAVRTALTIQIENFIKSQKRLLDIPTAELVVIRDAVNRIASFPDRFLVRRLNNALKAADQETLIRNLSIPAMLVHLPNRLSRRKLHEWMEAHNPLLFEHCQLERMPNPDSVPNCRCSQCAICGLFQRRLRVSRGFHLGYIG